MSAAVTPRSSAVRRILPRGLRLLARPTGLVLLGMSILLALAITRVPLLASWASRAPFLLLWGLAVYAVELALARREARSATSEVMGGREPRRKTESAVAEARIIPTAKETPSTVVAKELLEGVEEALRSLNKPATLARCSLISRIPCLLAAAARSKTAQESAIEASPLQTAQALRQVMIDAIGRFKPADEAAGGESVQGLQYHVLHEEYVLQRSIRQISLRHAISEATFYRYRAAAVGALALDLIRAEAILVRRESEPPATPS